MFKKTLMALSLAGLTAMTVAHAETMDTTTDAVATPEVAAPASSSTFTDDRWYAAPFGSFVQPSGDRNAQGGWGGGLALGKIINEYFNVEVRGFWQNWGNNGIANTSRPGELYATGAAQGFKHGATDMTGGTIDLQYYFMRDTFSPYAVFAVGGANNSWRGLTSNTPYPAAHLHTQTSSFIFEAGAGATYELADNFLLRADARYRGDTAAGSYYNNYGLNSHTSVFNDLVVNVGFVVPFGDKPGAAAAPMVADACASRDSDADGVNDCDDKCPGTASGTKVDDQGCPIVMELRGVNFKYDSHELTPGAKTILDGVVEQLVAMPSKKDIEVAGYASFEGKKGKEQHNLHLSQRRSESVAAYLRKKGVSNNLFAKGYGTEFPVADNATEDGRVKNRRVELRWMGD